MAHYIIVVYSQTFINHINNDRGKDLRPDERAYKSFCTFTEFALEGKREADRVPT